MTSFDGTLPGGYEAKSPTLEDTRAAYDRVAACSMAESGTVGVTLRAAWIFGLGCGDRDHLRWCGVALLLLLAVAMAATTVGDLLRSPVFPLLRWVQTVAALLLIAAGGYIIAYQVRGGLW